MNKSEAIEKLEALFPSVIPRGQICTIVASLWGEASKSSQEIESLRTQLAGLAQELATATRKLEEASKDVEPDMFWDAANPEDSFNENPHEIACTLSENLQLGEEAVFDIQCAISLADRKMRVKLDANGDFDWEWVDQAIEQDDA
jgi:hypothetical protein